MNGSHRLHKLSSLGYLIFYYFFIENSHYLRLAIDAIKSPIIPPPINQKLSTKYIPPDGALPPPELDPPPRADEASRFSVSGTFLRFFPD